MERIIKVRLKQMGLKVKDCVTKCTDILNRLNDGGLATKEDRLELKLLQQATERLSTELQSCVDKNIRSPGILKLVTTLSTIQFNAEEIALRFQETIGPYAPAVGTNPHSVDQQDLTNIRLPKLEFEVFDGDLLKWSQFWESFSSLIAKKSLTDVDKLHYLKSALVADPKELVCGLVNTNANYAIAVDRLTRRYGKPGRIVDAHSRAITRMPTAGAQIADCRRTLNELEKHLDVLKTLGEDPNANNLLRATILDKFPDVIKQDLHMKTDSDSYSVDQLRNFLDQIISSRENMSSEGLTDIDQKISFTTDSLHSQVNPAKSRMNKRKGDQESPIKGEPPNKKPKFPCALCGESHYTDRCTQYKTLEQRKSKLKGLCFLCLRDGHLVPDCPLKQKLRPCPYCKRQGHHNRSLCPTKFEEKSTNISFSISEGSTILPTVYVPFLSSSGAPVSLRVLLDTGSQRSYIHMSAFKRLNLLPLDTLKLTIYSFGNARPKTVDTRLVCLTLPIPTTSDRLVVHAYVVPMTTSELPAFSEQKASIASQCPTLIFAPDMSSASPADVIIGNDYYHSFFSGKQRKILAPNLFLEHTHFGWMITGRCAEEATTTSSLSVLTYVSTLRHGCTFKSPDPPFELDNIKDIWELETIGIMDSPKVLQDEEVIKHFNDHIQRRGVRYYVKFPWVEHPPDLPNNFGQAVGRLWSLLKHTSPDVIKKYHAVLEEQLAKGIIEVVDQSASPVTHPVYYLPHHWVIQEHKSTKLRIVYDGSAKMKGCSSLNELLYKGFSLLQDMTSLLLRFRLHRFGVVADIEKAFLQVGLQEDDRDVTRFLWIKNLTIEPSDDNLIQLRFCRVPFGIISSPFLLAAVIRFHLNQTDSVETRHLAEHLYVDNLVTGTDNTLESTKLFTLAQEQFQQLSMNIREWNSNDKNFLSSIPEAQRDNSRSISVLGVKWDTVMDHLTLGVQMSLFDRPVKTKRNVLHIIASVFDPCGWAAPYTLPSRLFLQSLWEQKIKWDMQLEKSHLDTWAICAQSLKAIPAIQLPRFYLSSDSCQPLDMAHPELHCFTDASKDAYVASIYLRGKVQDKYIVTLVISKSRLTPIKYKEQYTTPKLELLALLIGTRLVNYVRETLPLHYETITIWSDSMIALGWLRSEKLLPPFVMRRVAEIKKSTHVHFRHVPTNCNPADMATRRLHHDVFPTLWFQGPDFLRLPSSDWHLKGVSNVSSLDVTTHTILESTAQSSYAINEKQSSSPTSPISTPLSDATTLEHCADLPSEGVGINTIQLLNLQRQHFPKEMKGQTTPLARSLGLFHDDDGILRCKGRFANADFSMGQKYPILLPTNAPVTNAIIQRVHDTNYHVGVSHTLSLVRKVYWIPRGRTKVSKILSTCPRCVKYGGGPYRQPLMPDLPTERVTFSHPFTYTGVDYFGPLTIVEQGVRVKRYCCLFTCMAVRAVHLELVTDLSTEEFLLCLRRFVAVRGVPHLLVSDNATHFKLAATILNSPLIQTANITWRFIPALSPWQGGFYERLIGLVKHCLYRSLDTLLLGERQLQTVLKEVEAVLNSRPLTTVGKDMEDVLTPAHFLKSCGPTVLSFHGESMATVSTSTIRDKLVESWKRTSCLLKKFRLMFLNQYLSSLRERHKFDHRQPRIVSRREPAVGDTVQLKGDHNNRTHWKVGRITALLSGADGSVRTARVTLPSGLELTRPIALLYPLELDPSLHTPQSAIGGDQDPATQSTTEASAADAGEDDTPYPPDTHAHSQPHDLQPSTDFSDSSQLDSSSQGQLPPRAAKQAAITKIRDWTSSLFSAAITAL